jgi:hypothetical protein
MPEEYGGSCDVARRSVGMQSAITTTITTCTELAIFNPRAFYAVDLGAYVLLSDSDAIVDWLGATGCSK